MDSQRSKVIAISLIGATIIGLAIYRRFFSSKHNKCIQKSEESSRDKHVADENHEISPPVAFKSDDNLRNDEIATIVGKEPIAQRSEDPEVVEDIIVPAAVDSVEFCPTRNSDYGEMPPSRNGVDDFVRLSSEEFDADEVLEFSPPVDFKNSNVDDEEALLTSTGGDGYDYQEESPSEIVEEMIAPSAARTIASAPQYTYHAEAEPDSNNIQFISEDIAVPDDPIPEHLEIATSTDSGTITSSSATIAADINTSSTNESPPPHAADLPPLENIVAEVDQLEGNFNSLSKLGYPETVNGAEGTALNSSRVSDDSSLNGCSSVTDSGIGSTVVNDGEKLSETYSVASVISSDYTDTGRSMKETAADLKRESEDICAGANANMADTNGTTVETVPSVPDMHRQTSSTESKTTPKNEREHAKASPSARVVREFYMPETMCGRFIGKGGRNISALKHQTSTNIKVGRELALPGHKCCSVEGTTENVERALRLIQKQYPEVDVSGAMPPAMVTLSANMMQLILPVGVMLDGVISHIESAGHVFVQQPTHPTFSTWQLSNMNMNASYADGSGAPALPAGVEDGILCVASMNGQWHRAQVLAFTEEGLSCDIKLMDIGGYTTVDTAMIRQIRADFLQLPFQATECYLANIAPLEGDVYSAEAAEQLSLLVSNQVVQCQSVAVSDHNNIPYVHIIAHHNHKAIVVNKELANKGLVTWYDMSA